MAASDSRLPVRPEASTNSVDMVMAPAITRSLPARSPSGPNTTWKAP
jgi:hypothetical protein